MDFKSNSKAASEKKKNDSRIIQNKIGNLKLLIIAVLAAFVINYS